ncbi:uncharacterized protein A4U43_C07F14140 [Asparagus officinalis]|uniref:Exopolygalacturonase n=1 Tax=Asparagus officinalis TaxID=4686 RepID=A0A5P1EH25_ASPOF|nr:exopolygalacturonase-like [Asparagus officinalis]ONK63350.1 uncharacterized protein A4U43_C07F14140 [Asparagus officinalis]
MEYSRLFRAERFKLGQIHNRVALETTLKLACFSWLVICVPRPCRGQEVFDVTKYGAISNGKTDNSKAFSDAWSAACKHRGAASFLIPKGSFLLGQIIFQGPCSNNTSPKFEIKGKLLAPASPTSITTIAWLEFRALNKLIIEGGGVVDAQGATSWNLTRCTGRNCHNSPLSTRFIKISNATIANLTLLNSKGYHMAIQRSNFVTVLNLNISAPGDSPNTDGLHISDCNNINVTRLAIGTGDDCISIGPGNNNVSISGVNCGPGHGISVGGLGKYMDDKDVIGVKVNNCTISNTQNGIRIKTWPGSQPGRASNFKFEDIIVNNVSRPIIIDQEYCPKKTCSNKPSLFKVNNVTFNRISGTSSRPVAVNLKCSSSVPCENVKLHDVNLEHINGAASDITSKCFNVKGLVATSKKPDSTLSKSLAKCFQTHQVKILQVHKDEV